MSDKQKNVLGEDLEECSNNPLTGWDRDRDISSNLLAGIINNLCVVVIS